MANETTYSTALWIDELDFEVEFRTDLYVERKQLEVWEAGWDESLYSKEENLIIWKYLKGAVDEMCDRAQKDLIEAQRNKSYVAFQ